MVNNKEITPSGLKRLRTTTHTLIFKHLDAADVLVESFPQCALVMAITALEEVCKLKKLSRNQPMSENEWNELVKGYGIHKKKIICIFKEGQDSLLEMDRETGQKYDEIMHAMGYNEVSINEIQENIRKGGDEFLEALENLQHMKLDALYAGWSFKRKDVKSLTETLGMEDLKLLTNYLCDRVYALVIGLDLKYLYFVGGFVDPRSASDPLWRELHIMRKKFHSDDYIQKTATVISILKQYPTD